MPTIIAWVAGKFALTRRETPGPADMTNIAAVDKGEKVPSMRRVDEVDTLAAGSDCSLQTLIPAALWAPRSKR